MITSAQFRSGLPVQKVLTSRHLDGRQVPIDIRSFITPYDCVLTQIIVEQIFKMPLFRIPIDLDHETILRECTRWVIRNIQYVADVDDLWQLPVETVALRTGDCEDGANLLASLLLACGIPPTRLRVCLGNVWAHGIPGRDPAAHVWVCYTVMRDGQEMGPTPFDWCWRCDVESLITRRLLSSRTEYDSLWYTYNNQDCMRHGNEPAGGVQTGINNGIAATRSRT